jgi:hypothetical protein
MGGQVVYVVTAMYHNTDYDTEYVVGVFGSLEQCVDYVNGDFPTPLQGAVAHRYILNDADKTTVNYNLFIEDDDDLGDYARDLAYEKTLASAWTE